MTLTVYNLYLDMCFPLHGVKLRFSLGWNVCMCRFVAVKAVLTPKGTKRSGEFDGACNVRRSSHLLQIPYQ